MSKKSKRITRANRVRKQQKLQVENQQSSFSTKLLERLFVFNIASVFAFLVLLYIGVSDVVGAISRYDSLSESFRKVFISLWVISTSYRFYLNRVENPKLKLISLNANQLKGYATRQILSTLLSTIFALCAALYLSGILDPLAVKIMDFSDNLDKELIELWLSIASSASIVGALFLGVAGNALWDIIKIAAKRLLVPRIDHDT
ncbi:hypothetical protein HC024_01150 [Methylococcaceae bacterium WWC4]|nr:hypothetical protein [Methylococcaceae bacterium WWC4]